MSKTYLAGCVHDLGRELRAIALDDLAEGVLDGRVVALHEVTLYKLHGEGRLSCSQAQSVHKAQLDDPHGSGLFETETPRGETTGHDWVR
jgi:hypothetical protein